MTEQEIIDKYSTPGLRRNILTPRAHYEYMRSQKVSDEDARRIAGLDAPSPSSRIGFLAKPELSGDVCQDCGSLRMLRTGHCLTCQDCGSNTGCS